MTSADDRIIEAALTLIGERGLGEVTMVEVARQAGVARQTLYNHYSDVAAIVAEAAVRHNAAAIAHLTQMLSVVSAPVDVIEQIVRHTAAVSAHAGHGLDTINGLPLSMRRELSGLDTELDRQIRAAIVAGMERGDFRADLDADMDTRLVRAMLQGVSAMVADTPEAASTITAHATRTITAALSR